MILGINDYKIPTEGFRHLSVCDRFHQWFCIHLHMNKSKRAADGTYLWKTCEDTIKGMANTDVEPIYSLLQKSVYFSPFDEIILRKFYCYVKLFFCLLSKFTVTKNLNFILFYLYTICTYYIMQSMDKVQKNDFMYYKPSSSETFKLQVLFCCKKSRKYRLSLKAESNY